MINNNPITGSSCTTAPTTAIVATADLQIIQRWLGQKVLPTYLVNNVIFQDPHDGQIVVSEPEFQRQVVDLVRSILESHRDLGRSNENDNVTNDFELISDEDEDDAISKYQTTDLTYFQTFLKLLIRRLERASIPVYEELTELYAELIMLTPGTTPSVLYSANNASPASSIVSYFISSSSPSSSSSSLQLKQPPSSTIRLFEAPNIISANGSTGHRTWEAALALTDFFLTSGTVLSALLPPTLDTVVELGAGTGLVGLAVAAATQAKQVILTDGDPGVVQNLQANIDLNQNKNINKGQQQISAQQLLWNVDDPIAGTDLVLAADVTYDSSVIPLLVACLAQFLNPNPSSSSLSQPVVLVAATVRSEETLAVFKLECASANIVLTEQRRYSHPQRSELFFFPPASPDVIIYSLQNGLLK